MGFLSSLLSTEPEHRKFARVCRDYCVKQELTAAELSAIEKVALPRGRFVVLRNTQLVMLFNLMLMQSLRQFGDGAGSPIACAHDFFRQYLSEYYNALSPAEQESQRSINEAHYTYAMVGEAPERLYAALTGRDLSECVPQMSADFREFYNGYVRDAFAFFKPRAAKLKL